MNNTTLIIPVFEITKANKEYFIGCLESIKNQNDKNFKVAVVAPKFNKELESLLKDFDYQKIVNDSGKTDFASQVNFAVSKIETEYFSVVQFDDVIFPNHVQNINKYISAYSNIDCFVPLVYEVDFEDKPIGFSNETVWSAGTMEKFGYFDLAKTKEKAFYNFNVNCFTIKKSTFEAVGKLKSSILKFGDFEFLLRLLNFGKMVYVIPKMTYKHFNGISGSIHDMQKDMDEMEKKFWYNMSRKEYFFDYDREISYP